MATKVFLSWSGELSRKLAEAIRNWLPSALQYVKPYFTPEDIEKGAKWGPEISKELETSNIGIVCLTRDNTEKPWILFEAGALSKSIDRSHVCTLLFDLDPTDIKGPLTSFQGTRFAKEDFKKLVETINSAAGDSRLESNVLNGVFEMWWPKLEQEVAGIIKNHGDASAKTKKRSDRDILEELLELTRLTTSRPSRAGRISPRAVVDLVGCIEELYLVALKDDAQMAGHILSRMDRPIRLLCADAGVPEAYERTRIWTVKRPFLRRLREAEDAVEVPTKPSEG